jgi:hypothetical protein
VSYNTLNIPFLAKDVPSAVPLAGALLCVQYDCISTITPCPVCTNSQHIELDLLLSMQPDSVRRISDAY